MKWISKTLLSISFFAFCALNTSQAQNTAQVVYSIFQQNCNNSGCHNSNDRAAGLDLEGVGNTLTQKQLDVHGNVFGVAPDNTVAQSKNEQLIFPGDPYKSFLFRKVNNELSPEVELEPGEGDAKGMLSDKEIEIIRQWILFGAPSQGNVIDTAMIASYYDDGGVNSLLQIPAAPDPSEGFQIHVGPYFLPPSASANDLEEVEYLLRYETQLPDDIEIHRIETHMGNYSHHFILYRMTDPNNLPPAGMRDELNFENKTFISVSQFSDVFDLPEGTAIKWEAGAVLDLNSHAINYSETQVSLNEVFVNVYTQPAGTALHEMRTQLIPNFQIFIPNDNQPVTFNHSFSQPQVPFDIYIWSLTCHTHKYGKDFNIYRRNADGTRGIQVYDAGCPSGIPGCQNELYDYQHPPVSFYEPFMAVNLTEGAIAEATYQNDGPNGVGWGFTSSDEMMLYALHYTLDTAGISFNPPDTVSTAIGVINAEAELSVEPNPFNEMTQITAEVRSNAAVKLRVFALDGTVVYEESALPTGGKVSFTYRERNDVKGMFLFTLHQEEARIARGKLISN